MSGHGGARAGAGRPRVRLAQLVAERRFDWRRPTHRRALLEDELPDGIVAELAAQAQIEVEQVWSLINGYRRQASVGSAASAAWLAQRFADLVTDPGRGVRVEAHRERLQAQARRASARRGGNGG